MKKSRTRAATDRPQRRTNWTFIALAGGLVLLVAILAFFANSRSSDQDKLTNAKVVTSSAPSRDRLCAKNSTYELIKRELFRRAAQVRGSDQAAYGRLADFAVVRMENPVEENENTTTGTVNCSGSLSLDLPPGVAVAGGRRSLMSDVDYSLSLGTGGSATLAGLRNADTIITPLATLTRVHEAETGTAEDTTSNEAAAQVNSAAPDDAGAIAPAPAESPAASNAQPSFDCTAAHSRGERAICSNPGLGALDRKLAAQYSRALASASPAQRIILGDTAHRFQAFRDRCPSNTCIAEAYISRMREIRDIVEGRWQPSQ